ncbi:MAG: hypothetical protein JNM06_15190, partial [Blastocatellia bacterium]|nr:hypothetical protein [Blastocatellia bacterium]
MNYSKTNKKTNNKATKVSIEDTSYNKGISRIDSFKSRTFGWYVRVFFN